MTGHVLFLAAQYKGNEAFCAARALGFRPLVLTTEALLHERWDTDVIEEVGAVPSLSDRSVVRNVVAYLARSRQIVRVATVDDAGVDLAAHLREFLQIDGMGESAARLFRDKLAMRRRAHARGVAVPAFVSLVRDDDVATYLDAIEGPWLLKPRSEASSKGISTLHSREEAWAAIEALGDARVDHLIERFVPGELYHVDSIVNDGRVQFAEAHRYNRPLLEIVRTGGMMVTRTVERGSALSERLLSLNAQIIEALGMRRGVAHTEILVGHDGVAYFLESAARVGGAHIPSLVEATTGVSLWQAYTHLELLPEGTPFSIEPAPHLHGALLITLSRHEAPVLPPVEGEIAWTLQGAPYQAAMVLRHQDSAALDALLEKAVPWFAAEYGK